MFQERSSQRFRSVWIPFHISFLRKTEIGKKNSNLHWALGQVQFADFFAYFSVSQKRNIKRNPNRTKPSRVSFLEQMQSRRLGVEVKEATRRPRGRRARPPPSWAPRSSTDLLVPPIYTYVPPNHQNKSQHPISTAATFCTREIPSWGLFRRSAGGGIDHGGPLYQLHGPSDDV